MKGLDKMTFKDFQPVKMNCFLFLPFHPFTGWFLEVDLSDGEIFFFFSPLCCLGT
jgi:hypothetical protein